MLPRRRRIHSFENAQAANICICARRFEQLVQLVTMIGDKGELPIAMALASVVTTNQMVSRAEDRDVITLWP